MMLTISGPTTYSEEGAVKQITNLVAPIKYEYHIYMTKYEGFMLKFLYLLKNQERMSIRHLSDRYPISVFIFTSFQFRLQSVKIINT